MVRSNRSALKARPLLEAPGWSDAARRRLERVIRAGAGRRQPVAFDFDNSIVCGDIGEATLAILARDGFLPPRTAPALISPPFSLPDGSRTAPAQGRDLTEYYERLLGATAHATADPAPLATGYVWAVEAMAGLSVARVAAAAEAARVLGRPGRERPIEVTPGGAVYPAPWFYPEMVELIGVLLDHEYDVWIVSASNVWSVRWMVQRGLNPLLRRACGAVVPPERVIGVSMLLQDARGCWHKDPVLVREDARYARLDPASTVALTLTTKLHFPVPVYSGKVACLWDALGGRPYLAVGDSPGDHAMLRFSRHRLWIARLEKPDYQRATMALRARSRRGDWIFQPTLTRRSPGFVPDPGDLGRRLGDLPSAVRASFEVVGRAGFGLG
ncbi:MAG TPA: hypothetical protein PKM73_05795 [Verrucomicrobiota bacterium]|nr:hypothetical protein [Verrucomicrobiota bacterium]